MSYCPHCGADTSGAATHSCQETAAAAGQAPIAPIAPAKKSIDRHKLLQLLRNPYEGLRLEPVKDAIYGYLGLAASLLGFLIWAAFVNQKINALLDDFFGGFAGLLLMESRFSAHMTGKLFAIGLFSLIGFLGALWLVGVWRGSRRLPLLTAAIKLGGMQLTSGAGFLLAGLITPISLQLSMLILLLTLLSTLVWSMEGFLQLFEVQAARRAQSIVAAIALYSIVYLLLAKLFL